MHRAALGLVLGLLAACSPYRPPTRADIPLVWGLRWDADSRPDSADLAALHAIGARHLLIELPVASGPHGLPVLLMPDSTAWRGLRKQLTASPWRLSLALYASPTRPLFTEPAPPDRWLDHLGQELTNRLLPQLAGLPLDRLVVGIDWRPLEPYAQPWQRLTDRLRRELAARFPQPVALTYGADARRLDRSSLWGSFDEIGLVYPPQESRSPTELRRQHRQADSLCAAWGKPLFVVQANLIGPRKAEELEARLSFWSDSLPHRGLTLNTIYPRSTWADSNPWFGGAADSQFQVRVRHLLRSQQGH